MPCLNKIVIAHLSEGSNHLCRSPGTMLLKSRAGHIINGSRKLTGYGRSFIVVGIVDWCDDETR
jgi:hypothetical protein